MFRYKIHFGTFGMFVGVSVLTLSPATALARSSVLECIQDSVFADRLPTKWRKSKAQKEGFYLNADTPRIRIEDQRFFVRDPALPVKDPNYILNAVESIDYFDKALPSLERVQSHDLKTICQKMHKVAALGKQGDRPYSGTTRKLVEPGEIWEHDGLTNGRPSRKYAEEVQAALGLKFTLKDGRIKIGKLPQEALPGNLEGRHHYPASQYFDAYFDYGAKLLRMLDKTQPGSEDSLKIIAIYYHTMANARPFNTINNSLFFNQTNYLLRRYGFEAASQGYLDHLAHQLQPRDFYSVFKAHLWGKVPPPSLEIKHRL